MELQDENTRLRAEKENQRRLSTASIQKRTSSGTRSLGPPPTDDKHDTVDGHDMVDRVDGAASPWV